jgi:hypothetical protein
MLEYMEIVVGVYSFDVALDVMENTFRILDVNYKT